MTRSGPSFRFALAAAGVMALAFHASAQDRQVMPRPSGPMRPVEGRPAESFRERPREMAPPQADGPREVGPRGGGHVRVREVDPRPGPAPRVNRITVYPGTRTAIPPAWPRCAVLPTIAYWRDRDLMAEIQWLSRRAFVPVTPLGDTVASLDDYVQMPSGWRAYGISVPVGGTVQVEVKHPKVGWFRLMMVDKWGTPGPGMLQAAIAPQPILVTYKNPNKEATAIYVIVDDPAWWSDAKDPYTLVVRRDWDPAKADLSGVKMVAGLWGASPSVSAEFRGPSLSGPAVYPR